MNFRKEKEELNGNSVDTIASGNEQSTAIVVPTDEPPDGGYGWVVCYALGQLNGFTVCISTKIGFNHVAATWSLM